MYVVLVFLAILVILCLLICLSNIPLHRLPSFSSETDRNVYCLMVTSNDPHRRPFCKLSIRNFKEQSHPHKRLIVMNLSDVPIVSKVDSADDSILEVFLKQNNLTLGEIRNLSLELVPPNAWWTLWDDDDWRSSDYISQLVSWSHGYDFVMIQNRIEYNITNGFAYTLTLRTGLMSFFSRRHPLLRYEHVNTKEDVIVKQTALRHFKTRVVNNPSHMYIRLIHGKNTSPFVDARKNTVRDTRSHKVYFERELRDGERAYLRKILSTKYKHAFAK